MNAREQMRAINAANESLDEALNELESAARKVPGLDRAYRVKKAQAILKAQGTVEDRKAHGDLAAADEREAFLFADEMRTLWLEVVRSRRQQLSAIQTGVNSFISEANALGSRRGP